jgi:hypothetical protein
VGGCIEAPPWPSLAFIVSHEEIICPLGNRAPLPGIFSGYSDTQIGLCPVTLDRARCGPGFEPETLLSSIALPQTHTSGWSQVSNSGRLSFFFMQTRTTSPTGQYFPVPNIPLLHVPHVASNYFCTSQASHPWIYPLVTPALPPAVCKNRTCTSCRFQKIGYRRTLGHGMSHTSNFDQYRQKSSFADT